MNAKHAPSKLGAARQLTLALVSECQIVVIPGDLYPTLALDMEQRSTGWWASVTCHLDRSGLDCWRGPYPSRKSAERNAALWGRDMLRRRGFPKMVRALNRHFALPNVKVSHSPPP